MVIFNKRFDYICNFSFIYFAIHCMQFSISYKLETLVSNNWEQIVIKGDAKPSTFILKLLWNFNWNPTLNPFYWSVLCLMMGEKYLGQF